jgi:hypothetical protein
MTDNHTTMLLTRTIFRMKCSHVITTKSLISGMGHHAVQKVLKDSAEDEDTRFLHTVAYPGILFGGVFNKFS